MKVDYLIISNSCSMKLGMNIKLTMFVIKLAKERTLDFETFYLLSDCDEIYIIYVKSTV